MRDFIVLATGGLLMALALPNEVVPSGLPFLAPVVLIPVFWFTRRRPWWVSAFAGVGWVGLVTVCSQFWLLSFHPLAFPIVLFFQAFWYALAFAGSSWLWARWPGAGVWFQAAWWTLFEWLRLQGFFSYPYGSIASTLWSWPVTFQTADLMGVSGITFLLAFTAAWGARWWAERRLPRGDAALGLTLWAGTLAYGAVKLSVPETGPVWKPALIQQSQDPWVGGPDAYEAGLNRLKDLSRRALESRPDAVVWSETAFIPSVEYHLRYRENPHSLRLVKDLQEFLSRQEVPFLLGNDHREKREDGTLADYNAALAWDGAWVGRYEKNRLVPFTESFPYRDILPWVYDWLAAADTHFWEEGRGHPLLTLDGVKVGTPICYEDAFPEGPRAFSQAGAHALVNLTNDAWAPGKASRMQHLSLAVFRSVETRLPLVRAANDGATAAISSRGEVLALLPPGPAGVLQAEVHLGTSPTTAYTQWGDWMPIACLLGVLGTFLPRRRQSVVDKGPEL